MIIVFTSFKIDVMMIFSTLFMVIDTHISFVLWVKSQS
jgi:hypothetical protein